MSWQRPETQQIKAALREYAPQLAECAIEFLAEGWEFWAFTAGDHVLRFPKAERGFVWKLADQSSADSLRIERALAPELAPRLSTPISVPGNLRRTRPQRRTLCGTPLPSRRRRHV